VIESWHLVNVVPSNISVITLDSVKHPKLPPGRYWLVEAMTNPTSVSVWWINTFGLQGPSAASVNGAPFIRNDTTSGFYAFAVTTTVGRSEDGER